MAVGHTMLVMMYHMQHGAIRKNSGTIIRIDFSPLADHLSGQGAGIPSP